MYAIPCTIMYLPRIRDTPCSLPSFVPQILSTSDDSVPTDQWQTATQPNTNAAIENCRCPICLRTTDTNYQMTRGTIEYQDPSLPVVRTIHSTVSLSFSDCAPSLKESVIPYANQNIGGAHPPDINATVDHPMQAWSVAPQTPVCSQIICSLGLTEPPL